jgi:hypothetical protein
VKTALIEGHDVPEFDQDIVTNLLMKTTELGAVKKEQQLVAVKNARNEIYRVIGVTGTNSFVNATEELADLGLIDEPGVTRAADGYDAIYRPAGS